MIICATLIRSTLLVQPIQWISQRIYGKISCGYKIIITVASVFPNFRNVQLYKLDRFFCLNFPGFGSSLQ